MPNKTSILVQGTEVHIVSIDDSDFISLIALC